MSENPALKVDLIGERCPAPIVKLNGVFRGMAPGEEAQVSASDPAFELDLQVWCKRTGCELLQLGREDGVVCAILRKPR